MRRVPEMGPRGQEGQTNVNLPAACLVTAATTPPPPLSFPFFLSFFAPFMVSAPPTVLGKLQSRRRVGERRVKRARGETNQASEEASRPLEQQSPALDTGPEPSQVNHDVGGGFW